MALTTEDYRQAIQEMLDLFDALPQVSVKSRNVRLVQVAHGWANQIYRFARAILVLSDSGFEHEARVIVRSMLEYTITLHWLIEVGDDGVDAVMAEHQRSLRNASEKADPGLEMPKDIIRQVLDFEVPAVTEQETLRRFEQVCEELGIEQNLYIVYRVECSIAHPTFAAASEYLVERPDELTPAFVTKPSDETAVIALAAHCLVWAGRSLDSLLKDRPLREPLQKIARRIESARALPHRQVRAKRSRPARA